MERVLNRILSRCFGAGVLVGAVLAAFWAIINAGTLGHVDAGLGSILQAATLCLWPTSIFMMPIGPGTGFRVAMIILAVSLFFNGFLYTLIGYFVIKLFHLVPNAEGSQKG